MSNEQLVYIFFCLSDDHASKDIALRYFKRFSDFCDFFFAYSLISLFCYWTSTLKLTFSVCPFLVFLCFATYGCWHPCFYLTYLIVQEQPVFCISMYDRSTSPLCCRIPTSCCWYFRGKIWKYCISLT